MKVLQEFPVGLQQSSLIIGDGTRVAERFDRRLRSSQFVARDLREQVMLDLVVQTTVPEVGKGVGLDVSAGENLPAQEGQPAVLVQNGHAFVVGGEDGGQIQTVKPLVDDDEQHGLPKGQKVDQQAKVQHKVDGHAQRFGGGVFSLFLEQKLDAANMLLNASRHVIGKKR